MKPLKSVVYCHTGLVEKFGSSSIIFVAGKSYKIFHYFVCPDDEELYFCIECENGNYVEIKEKDVIEGVDKSFTYGKYLMLESNSKKELEIKDFWARFA